MPDWINSNSIHNVLNTLIVISGSAAGFDFSALGVSPPFAGKVVAILGLTKLIMNGIRDGIPGMVKPQPPVK